MEPELLKKTALMLAVKNFGEFHQKTTEIYSTFYHEGHKEYHIKALRVQNIESCKRLCNEMFEDEKYESCLNYCLEEIAKMNKDSSADKLGAGNFEDYLRMLMQGLESSLRTMELKKGITISVEISTVISSFKYKDLQITFDLFRQVLLLHLLLSPKKYFLYKLVLLTVHIRGDNERLELDELGNAAPAKGKERGRLVDGLSHEYFGHENHSNWIHWIIFTLNKSFQYFNFLEDLFNNYQVHIRRYNN
jgi:hypothetical protein